MPVVVSSIAVPRARTFPYARPQNIAIIDIHHYPLSIQGVFVNGSRRKVAVSQALELRQKVLECLHVTPAVIGGNIPPARHSMLRARVRAESTGGRIGASLLKKRHELESGSRV